MNVLKNTFRKKSESNSKKDSAQISTFNLRTLIQMQKEEEEI